MGAVPGTAPAAIPEESRDRRRIPVAAAARAAVAPYWFAPIAITVWWWFLPPNRVEAAMAADRGGAPTTVADPLFSGAFAFFGSHSAFDREIFR